MQITHPKVKKIVSQAERRIKALTGNESVLLVVLKQPNAKLPFEQVEKIVCEVRGFEIEKVYSKTRKREIVLTRHLIAHYAKICCEMTLVEIGNRFGKDHTTIISNLRHIRDMIETGDHLVFYSAKEINKRLDLIAK